MKITGKTKVFGIIGWPVAHSLSPVIHNAAFEYLGLDCCYIPFPVKEEDLDKAVRSITSFNISGINVTIPHKERVLSYLSEISPDAKIVGAVNTIKVVDYKLIGYNTDGIGFIASLREAGFNVEKQTMLVLGAGGAAKAVVFQSAAEGTKEIIIANRTDQKARFLKEQIATYFPSVRIVTTGIGYDDLKEAINRVNIIVNTTSIGLNRNDSSLLPPELMRRDLFICDLIYNPPETALLKNARKSGCQFINGMGMLLHQGAIAFKLWTDIEPPIAVMRRALEESLRSLNGY